MQRLIPALSALLLAAAPALAGVSEITFRTVFDNPGPYANAEVVQGSVWVDWTTPGQGGTNVGVSDGTFGLALWGRGDILAPAEPSDDFFSPLDPTAQTDGRRPAQTAGESDGFRHPRAGDGPGLLNYLVSRPSEGFSVLTANTGDAATGIWFQQFRDTAFFENAPSFEMFRFTLITPADGKGDMFVEAGASHARYVGADSGLWLFDDIHTEVAGIAYVPAPATVCLLALGALACQRRR